MFLAKLRWTLSDCKIAHHIDTENFSEYNKKKLENSQGIEAHRSHKSLCETLQTYLQRGRALKNSGRVACNAEPPWPTDCHSQNPSRSSIAIPLHVPKEREEECISSFVRSWARSMAKPNIFSLKWALTLVITREII
jgi:hypothetical protein